MRDLTTSVPGERPRHGYRALTDPIMMCAASPAHVGCVAIGELSSTRVGCVAMDELFARRMGLGRSWQPRRTRSYN